MFSEGLNMATHGLVTFFPRKVVKTLQNRLPVFGGCIFGRFYFFKIFVSGGHRVSLKSPGFWADKVPWKAPGHQAFKGIKSLLGPTFF